MVDGLGIVVVKTLCSTNGCVVSVDVEVIVGKLRVCELSADWSVESLAVALTSSKCIRIIKIGNNSDEESCANKQLSHPDLSRTLSLMVVGNFKMSS